MPQKTSRRETCGFDFTVHHRNDIILFLSSLSVLYFHINPPIVSPSPLHTLCIDFIPVCLSASIALEYSAMIVTSNEYVLLTSPFDHLRVLYDIFGQPPPIALLFTYASHSYPFWHIHRTFSDPRSIIFGSKPPFFIGCHCFASSEFSVFRS